MDKAAGALPILQSTQIGFFSLHLRKVCKPQNEDILVIRTHQNRSSQKFLSLFISKDGQLLCSKIWVLKTHESPLFKAISCTDQS